MGNNLSRDLLCHLQGAQGHHECEVLGRGFEAGRAGHLWENCKKNPGHEKFIQIHNLEEVYKQLPLSLSLTESNRETLKTVIDLTVKIRVQWTSLDRPNTGELSKYRGTDMLRVGTGFIYDTNGPQSNKPCPCGECCGKIGREFWPFYVDTARHVVYNNEEAKRTKVDLFCDDDTCHMDGRMKSVWAVGLAESVQDTDVCILLCVTHDRTLGEKIEFLHRHRSRPHTLSEPLTESFTDLLTRRANHLALVISHPHGQPKRVTVGKITFNIFKEHSHYDRYIEYDAPTCRGSSGAPVFYISEDSISLSESAFLHITPMYKLTHSGTYYETSWVFLSNTNYSTYTLVQEPRTKS